MTEILITSLLASLVINLSMFVVAYALQSDKLTDASYAISFMAISAFSLWQSDKDLLQIILGTMVLVWALRLGSFLLYRVVKRGKDDRFDGIRNNFFKFSKFWLAQAVTVWVLMIPAMFAFNTEMQWGLLTASGLTIWTVGFLFETISDYQKLTFSAKNKWIDSGLWKYSRHPNYFGEILVWVGVYLFIVSSLTLRESLVGLLSPLCITVLLVLVSGIPILERSADKRWGKLRAYQQYKQSTSLLVPLPKK